MSEKSTVTVLRSCTRGVYERPRVLELARSIASGPERGGGARRDRARRRARSKSARLCSYRCSAAWSVAGESERAPVRAQRLGAQALAAPIRPSGCLEEALEPADAFVRVIERPELLELGRDLQSPSAGRLAPHRPGERAAKVVAARPARCRAAAHRDGAVPAFRFASSATERKCSACRRYISSVSGDCIE